MLLRLWSAFWALNFWGMLSGALRFSSRPFYRAVCAGGFEVHSLSAFLDRLLDPSHLSIVCLHAYTLAGYQLPIQPCIDLEFSASVVALLSDRPFTTRERAFVCRLTDCPLTGAASPPRLPGPAFSISAARLPPAPSFNTRVGKDGAKLSLVLSATRTTPITSPSPPQSPGSSFTAEHAQ